MVNLRRYHPFPFWFLLPVFLVLNSCQTSKSGTETATEPQSEPDVEVALEEEVVVTPDKPYNPSERKRWALVHTRLKVKPVWGKRSLEGTARLRLHPHFLPQDSLVLDAQHFDLDTVYQVMGEDSLLPLRHRYVDSARLHIYLDRAFGSKDTLQLHMDYAAFPYRIQTLGGDAIEEDRGLYFIDPDSTDPQKPTQLWTQGQPESNSAWFPTIDAPNQKSTQEVFITVRNDFKSLSNGRRVYSVSNGDGTRTDYWRMDQPHAPYLFMLAAGPFVEVQDEWRGKPVNYYVEPEYAPYARMVFGVTPDMMGYFSDITGVEYPWPRYDQVVVRDFVSGAMENTTASVFYDALQHDRRAHKDRHNEGIIAHELFHHWFGDYVTCESWSQLSLNEGFATYGEILWAEHRHGHWEAEYLHHQDFQAYMQEASYNREPIIQPYYRQPVELFDRHRYQKGALVLHMLRHEVGDTAFFASLNHYLKENAYGTVEIHNLRLAFEAVTGRDLQWFFEQWFLEGGHPELLVGQQYDSLQRELEISFLQYHDLENYPLFRLPFNMEIHRQDGSVLDTLFVLDEEQDTFRVNLDYAPRWVNLDPEHQLLASISVVKSLEERKYQLRHSNHYLDKLQAINTLVRYGDSLAQDTMAVLSGYLLFEAPPRLRALGLRAVVDLAKDSIYLRSMSDRVRKLMTKDKEAYNRQLAVRALFALKPADLDAALSQATMDSSYATAATALEFLAKVDSVEALRRAEQIRTTNPDERLRAGVAKVFIQVGGPGKRPYLRETLLKLNPNRAGGLAYTYFDYLERLGDRYLLEELQQFEERLGPLLERDIMKYIVRGRLRKLRKDYQQKLSGALPEAQKALAEQIIQETSRML